jgi:type IV secretory pathway TrbD component
VVKTNKNVQSRAKGIHQYDFTFLCFAGVYFYNIWFVLLEFIFTIFGLFCWSLSLQYLVCFAGVYHVLVSVAACMLIS